MGRVSLKANKTHPFINNDICKCMGRYSTFVSSVRVLMNVFVGTCIVKIKPDTQRIIKPIIVDRKLHLYSKKGNPVMYSSSSLVGRYTVKLSPQMEWAWNFSLQPAESLIPLQQHISRSADATPVAGCRIFSILLGTCWVSFVLLIFCHAREEKYDGCSITL